MRYDGATLSRKSSQASLTLGAVTVAEDAELFDALMRVGSVISSTSYSSVDDVSSSFSNSVTLSAQ